MLTRFHPNHLILSNDIFTDLIEKLCSMNGSTANESPPKDENGTEGIRQRKHSHSRVKTEETNKSEPKEKDYTKEQLEAVRK